TLAPLAVENDVLDLGHYRFARSLDIRCNRSHFAAQPGMGTLPFLVQVFAAGRRDQHATCKRTIVPIGSHGLAPRGWLGTAGHLRGPQSLVLRATRRGTASVLQ